MDNKKLNIDDMLPIVGGYQSSFKPFYDYRVDYNTNAPSYYDYLAQYNDILKTIVDHINRLMAQSFDLEDTASIEYKNTGNHLGKIERFGEYTDNMKIRSNVKVSKENENGLKILPDGLYVKDFSKQANSFFDSISDLLDTHQTYIEENRKDIKDLKNFAKSEDELTDTLKDTILDHHKRIVNLEKNGTSSSGKSDPALERRVSVLESRVDGIRQVLKLEEERADSVQEIFNQYNKRFDDIETKLKDLTKLCKSLSEAVLLLQEAIGEKE